MIPLDVANDGTLPFLDADDIVEVPCRVDEDGPRPQAVAPIPDAPRALIEHVKAYERATVNAALTGSRDALVAALALNPLVPSREKAEQLLAVLF